MIDYLAVSIESLASEVNEITNVVFDTDNWQVPAVLTVAEAAPLLHLTEEQLILLCDEKGYPAKKINGQWMILSDAVLTSMGGLLAQEAYMLLIVAARLMTQSDLIPFEAKNFIALTKQLGDLLGIEEGN